MNTTYFPLGQFVSYMALMIYAWTYVRCVTLKSKDPFSSGNKGHKSFFKMLLIAPLIFCASGLIVMR